MLKLDNSQRERYSGKTVGKDNSSGSGFSFPFKPRPYLTVLPVWGQASTDHWDHWVELRSWHPQMRGDERQQHFTRGFFSSGQKSLSLWHSLSSIHCQEAIMSGLCNVCDYLSNCHGIVCQFLLFNRERQTQRERSGNSNVYLAEISQCEEQDKTRTQWKSHSNRVTWMLWLSRWCYKSPVAFLS